MTQVSEHRGVLARAVHADRGGASALPEPRVALAGVERVVRRSLQGRLVQAGVAQDLVHSGEVEALAAVRRRGQRQQVVGQVEPVPHHGDRLGRLVRRPGEDLVVGIAPASDDDPRRVDHDGMAHVDALGEPASRVGRDHGGRGTRHRRMMARCPHASGGTAISGRPGPRGRRGRRGVRRPRPRRAGRRDPRRHGAARPATGGQGLRPADLRTRARAPDRTVAEPRGVRLRPGAARCS